MILIALLGCVHPPPSKGGEDTGRNDSADSGDSDTATDSGDTDTASAARTWTVCAQGADFTEVQEAVDAASDGDTITVCPGTFGPVRIEHKFLNLQGAGCGLSILEGRDYITELPLYWSYQSTGPGSVQTASYSLGGFSLRWSATSTETYELLVLEYVYGTARDICIDGQNSGEYPLIYVVGGQATLTNVHVSSSVGEILTGGGGTDAPVIDRSVFVGNYHRAALFRGEVNISNSIIAFNTSSGAGYIVDGGATDGEMQDVAPSYRFVNNVLFGNVNFSPDAADEPALRLLATDIYDNIIAENTGGGLVTYGHELTAEYNLVWGNGGEDFNLDDAIGPGPTDLSEDPLFTDPDNLDFTLQPGSPAIDAGNPDAAYDDVDGTRNDMGAFGGPLGNWTP